jgi:phytoene desaturase
MVDKRILIVGAGPGGLAAGMLLAHRGFKVTIFEKNAEVGGRNGSIREGDFKFDIGPTFFMMKFVLDEIFQECGRKSEDYITFKRLEPMYRLYFDDMEVNPASDRELMKQEIARHFQGDEKGLDEFYKKEMVRFNYVFPMLKGNYSSFTGLMTPTVIQALPRLSFGSSLYDVLGRYFKEEKLKLSFTFQAKYLGMSPWDCPGGFTIIPFVEHQFGIYHVMGGLFEVPKAMAKAFKEDGGDIRLSSKVKRLLTEGKSVKGVELESGEKVYGDEVIVNADFGYAMSHLVDDGKLHKYSLPNLRKKKYSCSTFMLYLGLDKLYDLPHHNIVFAKDYRTNVADIFQNGLISDDMSIYIENPCITDGSLAPPGKSAVYVLVPVANNTSGIDWDKEKDAYKEKVLDTIARRTVMKDIREHIEAVKVITPAEWEKEYNVFYGATFNLAHSLDQMLYFRPHNQFEELDHCYLVGGGTHPGSGLPTIYESARISSNIISKRHGVPYKQSLSASDN